MCYENIITQTIDGDFVHLHDIHVDVLRLDLLDPVISGNKWFKLKYYLQEAIEKEAGSIATFGGAYSNHIAATAYACKIYGIKCNGIIRGEEPEQLSHTLQAARYNGMQLHFVSRVDYQNKEKLRAHFKSTESLFWIPEGGYGLQGVKGAKEILQIAKDASSYTHIVCAAGTATTMAGVISAANLHQEIIGFSVMKNNTALEHELKALLSDGDLHKNFSIYHDYHFGGYARHPKELIDFMNNIYQQYKLPLDFVYTAKAFYGLLQFIHHQKILPASKVLFIHSGGLQGNLSFPKGTLLY